MGYDILMSYGFLAGFQKTEIYSRTRDGCHVSTSGSGRDNFIGIRANGFSKINGVATDLFCTGVIGHPGYMFLN